MNIYTVIHDHQMLASLLLAILLFSVIFYFVRKSRMVKEYLPINEEGEFPPSVKKTRKMIPKNQTNHVSYKQSRQLPTKMKMIQTFRRMGVRGK